MEPAAAASSEYQRSVVRQLGLSELDAFVLCVAPIYTIAWFPRLVSPTGPQLALLLVAAPLGWWVTFAAVRRKDTASCALLMMVAVCVLAALLSPNPLMSLKGDVSSWMSVAVYALAAVWWSLGRALSVAARALAPVVLTLGAAVNAVVGLAQVVLDVHTGLLATFPGRASGLMQNPVYYGSFMAGICVYWAIRSLQDTRWPAVLLALGTSFAAGLSGSRIVLAVAVGATVAGVILGRTRSSLVTLGVVLVGFCAATAVTRTTSSVSTFDRLAGGETLGSRVGIWRYGFASFLERPAFGWGPNHFGTATARRLTPEYVRDFAYDDAAQPWIDPHNFVVLLAVSTGVIGLLAAALFIVLAVRGVVDRALMAAAIAVAATWLLQPATLHSLPVALLIFGAAVQPRAEERGRCGELPSVAGGAICSIPVRRGFAGALLFGLVAGGALATSMFLIDAAGRAGDLEAMEHRASLFRSDPYVQLYVARRLVDVVVRGNADDAEATLARAISAARRAANTFPSPFRWNRVAELHLLAGDLPEARAATERALRLQPWNPTGHRRLHLIGRLSEDDPLREQAARHVCLLGLDACPSDGG